MDEGHYFMRAHDKNSWGGTFVLALSIAALTIPVNAQDQSLLSVNKDESSTKPALKDSVKEAQPGASKLIEAVLKTGVNGNIGKNLAPIIGLPGPMPMKKQYVVISENGTDYEGRACWVINDNTEGNGKRSLWAYVLKAKRSGRDNQVEYFQIDPNGKLERAILSKSRAKADGKGVRGSGVKTDQDINSPEVRKTFETEMQFWLNDWLKKQSPAAAPKPA